MDIYLAGQGPDQTIRDRIIAGEIHFQFSMGGAVRDKSIKQHAFL
jgi:hypothetical protein